jgi:hypothetical protein
LLARGSAVKLPWRSGQGNGAARIGDLSGIIRSAAECRFSPTASFAAVHQFGGNPESSGPAMNAVKPSRLTRSGL